MASQYLSDACDEILKALESSKESRRLNRPNRRRCGAFASAGSKVHDLVRRPGGLPLFGHEEFGLRSD
jgi:hypothetical protein